MHTDLIDNVENLVKDVYGVKQVADTVSVAITDDFSLSFTCSRFSNSNNIPSGTWTCSNIEALYNNIFVNGQPLKHHHASNMDTTSIDISDSYLENDYWELIISINLNPDDVDSFPVGSVDGYQANKIFSFPQENTYPRIYGANSNEIKIALGYVVLPDSNVEVGSSEQILSVKAVNFGNVSAGSTEMPKDLNSLTTTYKTDLIGAINELVGKIDGLRQELVDNKYLT